MLKYILIFLFQDLHAQSVCALGFEKESNKINYNRIEVEKVIALENANAIFYGETHSRNFEPEFKLHFIQHLNDRFGIRDVFMEIGKSAAYFYNAFLETGDTTALNKHRLVLNLGYYKDFWYQLYLYNKNNANDKKIKIHGVDFERTEVFKLLDELKSTETIVPNNIIAVFSDIHQLAEDRTLYAFDERFEDSFNRIKKVFQANDKQIQIIYGKNYPIIQSALNNKAPVTPKVNPRNPIWFQSMNASINDFGIQKFVAFFGRSHTNEENNNSLPKLFRKQSDKLRILNIAGVYYNSQGYGKTEEELVLYPYGYKEKELYDENVQSECRATIVAKTQLKKAKLTTQADYYVFAKDFIAVRK